MCGMTCYNCQYGRHVWNDETEGVEYVCTNDDSSVFWEEVESYNTCSLFKQKGSDLNG
jgi:hypothetical protein